MLSAVDIPKSKQITIGYLSIKSTLLCYFLVSGIGQETKCTSAQSQLYSLFSLFCRVGLFFDVVVVGYFYLCDHFSKLEFYVFYLIHFISTVAMLFFILFIKEESNPNFKVCQVFQQIKYACLIVSSCFFINSFCVIVMGLYPALKLVNFGGNVVWSFLYYLSHKDLNVALIIVSSYHAFSTIMGSGGIVVVWMMGKSNASKKLWNLLVISNIIGLIMCYLLALLANIGKQNDYQRIYAKSYLKFGLIQILSPFLYLIFIRKQEGDPRQQFVYAYRDTFKNFWQNEQFCKNSVI